MIELTADQLKTLVQARDLCAEKHDQHADPLSDARLYAQAASFAITSVLKIAVLTP